MAYILPIPPRPLHNFLPHIQRPPDLPPQRLGTRSRSPPPTVHLSPPVLVPSDRQLSHGVKKPGLCALAPDGPHAPPNLSRAANGCAANRSAHHARVTGRQYARGNRAGCIRAGLVLRVVLMRVYERDFTS